MPADRAPSGPQTPQVEQRFEPRCDDGHRWPDDYESGDTCYCGAFYLMTRGGVRIVEAQCHDE